LRARAAEVLVRAQNFQDEHAKSMMRDIAVRYEGAMWIDDLVKRARERLLGTA